MRIRTLAFWVTCGALAGGPAFASWTVGVKNFRQIFASLSVLTQVPLTDPDIKAAFASQQQRLPKQGSLDEVTAPVIFSVLNVADVYCAKWIEAERQLAPEARHGHGAVDFTQGSGGLTAAVKADLVGKYTHIFWQRPATEAEAGALLAVLSQTAAAMPADAEALPKVLRPLCMNTIASLAFLTN